MVLQKSRYLVYKNPTGFGKHSGHGTQAASNLSKNRLKTTQKLATFFSPWRSIYHQIQHLRRTRDRIFGPVVRKILPGALWFTRNPNIQKLFKVLGSKKWAQNQNPGFFLEMSGMSMGSFLAYWGIIWGP